MFEITFGILWITISTIVFIPFYVSIFSGNAPIMMLLFMLPFSALFYGIGFYVLIKGLKQRKIDSETSKKGIFTHGRIISIKPSGNYANGVPELKASIATYVPYLKSVELYDEVIGFYPSKYKKGDYLILQYHKGDVNIIQQAQPNDIPIDQFEKINDTYPISTQPDEVIIDGVKYKKVSNNENNISSESTANKYNSEW